MSKEYTVNVDIMATIVVKADSPEEAQEIASALMVADIVALPSFQVVDLSTDVDPDEDDWDDEDDDEEDD